jgi:hypothetical protein
VRINGARRDAGYSRAGLDVANDDCARTYDRMSADPPSRQHGRSGANKSAGFNMRFAGEDGARADMGARFNDTVMIDLRARVDNGAAVDSRPSPDASARQDLSALIDDGGPGDPG